MTFSELKRNILDIVNEKINLISTRITNLEKDYNLFKNREISRDIAIEDNLNKKIENKFNNLQDKISNATEIYKMNIKVLNTEIDNKITEIKDVFNKKLKEIIEKNYDQKILNIEKNIEELEKSQRELNKKLDEILSLLT